MDINEYRKEWKRKQRELNTPYAQRQRAAKNSEENKRKRRQQRKSPAQKEKDRLYQIEYRKRPHARRKAKAREAAKQALVTGVINRPDHCIICGCADSPLADGRSGLRMDHHLGYDEQNWLKVKFICVKCDGEQLRKHE